MKYDDKINNILIVGGTHGNEMSGVQAVKNWQHNQTILSLDSIYSGNIEYVLANKLAIERSARFIDEDLNRLFSVDNLKALGQQVSALNNEQTIANSLSEQFGPKENPKLDFVIDIHNTTSNMGATLIILDGSEFYRQLARYVKNKMPESIILFEDNRPYADFGYLCTLGNRGIMIEVGPQPQGLLKSEIYHQTVTMTHKVLEFIELYNSQQIQDLPPADAFHLDSEIPYPSIVIEGKQDKSAMIHPSLYGCDFTLLSKGQPCFETFTGESIRWEGEDTYPHFIGEAAYYRNGLAFATAKKIVF